MYKYYMGRYSNLNTRNEDVPLVIAVDEFTMKFLNLWLDKHFIDFDCFIDSIKFVLKTEIVKICFESEVDFVLYLANEKIAFLNLSDERKIKATINIDEDFYVLNLKSKCLLEHCKEKVREFVFEAQYNCNTQKISISTGKEALFLEFEGTDIEIYEMIKKNIDKLENKFDISVIIYWVLKMKIRYPLINVTIYSSSFEIIKFEFVNNRISKYIAMAEDTEFVVKESGDWNARISNMLFRYDSKSGKRHFSFKNNFRFKIESFDKIIDTLTNTIETMFETIETVNEIIEELVE